MNHKIYYNADPAPYRAGGKWRRGVDCQEVILPKGFENDGSNKFDFHLWKPSSQYDTFRDGADYEEKGISSAREGDGRIRPKFPDCENGPGAPSGRRE